MFWKKSPIASVSLNVFFISEFLSNFNLYKIPNIFGENIILVTIFLRNDKGYYTYSSQVGGILLFEIQNFNTCIQSWCTFHNEREKTNAKTLCKPQSHMELYIRENHFRFLSINQNKQDCNNIINNDHPQHKNHNQEAWTQKWT